MHQLAFDLGHRPALGRADFLIAPCNADAVAWIDRWPDWPAPALIIHGPASGGKSHLAAVWAARSDALRIPAEKLSTGDARTLFESAPHLVFDHLDPWIGDARAETALFHIYNLAKEHGRSLLVTMRTPPAQHDFALPDLASRLRAAPAAPIQAPDDTLLASLLVKLFADRQLQVNVDVIQYILPRMERSFAAAHDIVARADALALAEKRNIAVPLIRDILSRMADTQIQLPY
jgi:chromosomal replication initiation ATPase DnaA